MAACTIRLWTRLPGGIPVQEFSPALNPYHYDIKYAHEKKAVDAEIVHQNYERCVKDYYQTPQEYERWMGQPLYTTSLTLDCKYAGEFVELKKRAEVFMREQERNKRPRFDPSDPDDARDTLNLNVYMYHLHPGLGDLEELNWAMVNVIIPILFWSKSFWRDVPGVADAIYRSGQITWIIPMDAARTNLKKDLIKLLASMKNMKSVLAALKAACILSCDVAISILTETTCNFIRSCTEYGNYDELTDAVRGERISFGMCARRVMDYRLGKIRSPLGRLIPLGILPMRSDGTVSQPSLHRSYMDFSMSRTPHLRLNDEPICTRISICGVRDYGRAVTTWTLSSGLSSGYTTLTHIGQLVEACDKFAKEMVHNTNQPRGRRPGKMGIRELEMDVSMHEEVYASIHLLDLSGMESFKLRDTGILMGVFSARGCLDKIFSEQPPNGRCGVHFVDMVDFAILESFPAMTGLEMTDCVYYRKRNDPTPLKIVDDPEQFMAYAEQQIFQKGQQSEELVWPLLGLMEIMPDPRTSTDKAFLCRRFEGENHVSRRVRWTQSQGFRIVAATTPFISDAIPNLVEKLIQSSRL